MKFTIASILVLACSTVATPARRDAFSDQALSLHNSNRQQYGAGPLHYDNNLASGAANYAGQCHFEHSHGDYGENLYAAGGTGGTIQDAVKSWMNEASKYDYNNPTFGLDTGHFTQVVWKATNTLGCGIHQCTNNSPFGTFDNGRWTYIVCRYTPAGNFQGQFGANVGRKQ